MTLDLLERLIGDALKKARDDGVLSGQEDVEIELERPKRREHGDWSTNVAMRLAASAGVKPRDLAQGIVDRMELPEGVISGVEVAGPGFINFHLTPRFLREALREIEEKGEKFGSSDRGVGIKVQIEFVSANPVGPLHVGHGRWAALGDALASVMQHAGYDASREFYINDFGTQMQNFGHSISARYLELLGEPYRWEDSLYAGRYIVELAEEIVEADGDKYVGLPEAERARLFADREYLEMLKKIENTLDRMGVRFDCWFSERELHRSGAVEGVVRDLEERGAAYKAEGAVWLKTSEHGDEKDRVLIRSNSEPTYFAADIAYHRDKVERGFERIIDIWGADHHGYVARMKAAMECLGYPPATLSVILGQLVKLFRGGEPVTMSKRTGEIITLGELLDEVGSDAARYFFLMRSSDSPLEFDIELAKEQSPENPVYYVQYAHARICSILEYARESGADLGRPTPEELGLLEHETEMELLRKLWEFEEVITHCAENMAPHRLTGYAEELAASFHAFYRDCRVVTDDEPLTRARLYLVDGVRRVLELVLEMLGVSAPESM